MGSKGASTQLQHNDQSSPMETNIIPDYNKLGFVAVFCISHICVLLLLGKSNSKVHVFKVLMLKTVLKWDC